MNIIHLVKEYKNFHGKYSITKQCKYVHTKTVSSIDLLSTTNEDPAPFDVGITSFMNFSYFLYSYVYDIFFLLTRNNCFVFISCLNEENEKVRRVVHVS